MNLKKHRQGRNKIMRSQRWGELTPSEAEGNVSADYMQSVLGSSDPALWTVWHETAPEHAVSADFTPQLLGASPVKTYMFSYCTLLNP